MGKSNVYEISKTETNKNGGHTKRGKPLKLTNTKTNRAPIQTEVTKLTLNF